jgi:putative heme-binding domain-containing protein
MQGAYYVKGFSKHGPLHNPYTYGYFEHVPYTGFKGGHVTCGGVMYEADVYPEQYRGQYIAGNLLSSAIYWHHLEAVKSSFKASHGGDLMTSEDPWFRPVDLMLGPDGCIYVADWYDKRAAHLDPVDSWHKTSGRIYRIEYKSGPKYETFDLRKKSTAELAELLKHPNMWWRKEARRLIAERGGSGAQATLRKWLLTEKGQLALESLWALAASGGWMEGDFANVGEHPNEYVRAWMIRLIGDEETISEPLLRSFVQIAAAEKSFAVIAQMACTARRFAPQQEIDIVNALLENRLLGDDPLLPLLVWWGMEDANRRDTLDVVRFQYPTAHPKLADFFNERVGRRLMSGNIQRGTTRIGTLFGLVADFGGDVNAALRGVAMALQAHPQEAVLPALREPLDQLLKQRPKDLLVLEVLARMKDPPARAALRDIVGDDKGAEGTRLKAIDLLRQVRDPRSEELFLAQLPAAKSDTLRTGLLAGLEAFEDASIGEKILAGYSSYSPAVKKRAIQTLLTRPAWAALLLKQWEDGKIAKADLTVDYARAAVKLEDKAVTATVEKHFGKLAPATAGEKQARIGGLNIALNKEKGDAARGKVLFTKHCAACHQLHGEGGKVGPDLTTADRKNRMYLLANIVDPNGYIRPEFVMYSVLTKDDRKFSGIATESSGESVTLVNVVNDQVVKTTVAKADVAEMTPSAVSLMPEKLLDTLTEPQVADLFAYLVSDAPAKNPTPQPPPPKGEGEKDKGKPAAKDAKKLRVGMVSGSFEYKSDDSLAGLKKHWEANYPVECVLVIAKAEKDTALAGLDALEKCDVVVLFTRRLQIEGESLDLVKKYVSSKKPIIGIRTASHGFQKWLEMDKEVLGGDYKGHFGAGVAEVKATDKGKDHPILKGITPFKTNGSLYKNPNVAADVTVLLQGYMGKESEPAAWTREKDGRRVFYTSLGHPDDFKDDNFIRLLTNGLAWATKTELKPVK